MKIVHFASYDCNIGDSSTIYTVKQYFQKLYKKTAISWLNLDGKLFHRTHMHADPVISLFSTFNINNSDLIVFGGGGQIESRPKYKNKFTLPIDKKVLQYLKVPIVCIGLGINTFRGSDYEELCEEGFRNFCLLVEKSKYFSLRNDGSYEIAENMFKRYNGDMRLLEKIKEIPDPGLLFEEEKQQVKKCNKPIFQPAMNNNKKVLAGRCLTDENFFKLDNFITKHSFEIMPHTCKDYRFSKHKNLYCMPEELFKQQVATNNYQNFMKSVYFNYDISVAMRGHGQLNALAINLPSLYFSTQDKVSDFSYKNGFGDYNIDIRSENWYEQLEDCYHKMANGGSYLEQWYEIRNEKMKEFRASFENSVASALQAI